MFSDLFVSQSFQLYPIIFRGGGPMRPIPLKPPIYTHIHLYIPQHTHKPLTHQLDLIRIPHKGLNASTNLIKVST